MGWIIGVVGFLALVLLFLLVLGVFACAGHLATIAKGLVTIIEEAKARRRP